MLDISCTVALFLLPRFPKKFKQVTIDRFSDIKPDGNIESEIFPPELTKEAQNKEVFTPPNHQQMRFMSQEE